MLQPHLQVTLSKSRFETIAMPMISSLVEHSFLPVFSMVGKMLYSNWIYNIDQPGDSRPWESPEKTDNVWQLFSQILLR